MKENFVNSVTIRGYVFSHTLQERERTDGTKAIMGLVNIATDDEAINVVPVNFYVQEKTRAGKDNATFGNLKQIMDSGVTYETAGTDANRVRVNGAIDVNDFYGRDGQLVSGKRVRGSFLHFLNAGEPIATDKTPATYFEADVLLQSAIERESNDGSEYMSLQGFAFNYRGDVLPVTFSISSSEGMNFFSNEDISANNPYFGKIWGDIRSTVVVTEQEADSTKTAFGAPVVQETSRTFRTWEVIGANVNEGMDDDTVTQEELKKKVAEREVRLAELAERSNAANNTATGKAGFPTAASAAKPAASAAADDYVF